MSILAYCITELGVSLEHPEQGVREMNVEVVEAFGMRCFISKDPSQESALGTAVRDSALAFHRVLHEIFQHTAIIPFRFPTILSDEAELLAHLQEHAAEYQNNLARLRDLVQMEIRIVPQNLTSSVIAATGTSGFEYLKSRQAHQHRLEGVARSLREGASPEIHAWRERTSNGGLRCFALISRDGLDRFQKRLAQAHVPGEWKIRVSGPWPATEFLQED